MSQVLTETEVPMPRTLQKMDWKLLLSRIKEGICTPFLGAGASLGSGYALADRLSLLLSSPRALTEYILDRFKDELAARDVASSRFMNIYNSIVTQRAKFTELLEFFRSGGFRNG